MSLDPVPQGSLAAVVTFLEMRDRPALAAMPKSAFRLRAVENRDPDSYREMFRAVGSNWLWFSRLAMSDDELAAILADPLVELFQVRDGASVVGMLELDFRGIGECEIAFVGLIPALSGKGHGRWLLSEAVSRAWRPGVNRVHVHTCTLDHPAALTAYRRAGFTPIARAIEIFDDPRQTGLLPRDAAPQVALIDATGN
jgi:GNAT superfamily N-acetyltransferase